MGCDIHLYVEYKRHSSVTNSWRSFTKRMNPGRIYGLFAALGNVRNDWDYKPVSADRGIPEDVGYEAMDDNTMFISDTENDDYVTTERAKSYVEKGYSVMVGEHRITNPDWHSHSWATTSEFEQAIKDVFCKDGEWKGDYVEYSAVLAAMKDLEKNGCEARIVFWFDN